MNFFLFFFITTIDASGYKQTYMCQCSTGWQGDQCELPAKCPLQCSGHGTCVAGGYCMCVLSWVGTACERPRAMSIELCPLQCSGHGKQIQKRKRACIA